MIVGVPVHTSSTMDVLPHSTSLEKFLINHCHVSKSCHIMFNNSAKDILNLTQDLTYTLSSNFLSMEKKVQVPERL